jgi:hypothetical protein
MILEDYEKLVDKLGTKNINENDTVYRLCVADVLYVLDSDDVLDKLEVPEIAILVQFIQDKLEIPWIEYVDAALSCHPIIDNLTKSEEVGEDG